MYTCFQELYMKRNKAYKRQERKQNMSSCLAVQPSFGEYLQEVDLSEDYD